MANMKNDNNVKRDVNVKLKNIRTRRFRVSVVDACFTNFTHEIACKLKKIQQNLVSKSDAATKTGPTLKRMHLMSRLGVNV